jgi:hypothetical protein
LSRERVAPEISRDRGRRPTGGSGEICARLVTHRTVQGERGVREIEGEGGAGRQMFGRDLETDRIARSSLYNWELVPPRPDWRRPSPAAAAGVTEEEIEGFLLENRDKSRDFRGTKSRGF